MRLEAMGTQKGQRTTRAAEVQIHRNQRVPQSGWQGRSWAGTSVWSHLPWQGAVTCWEFHFSRAGAALTGFGAWAAG